MDGGRKAGRGLSWGDQQHTPPFLSKTYDMVDDSVTDNVISWGAQNNSFVVWKPANLATDILPSFFKHSNFSSFVRQLNTYGFRKVDPDRNEFANDGFLRGQKHLLKYISRKKKSRAQISQPSQPHSKLQAQSQSHTTPVDVGIDVVNEIEMLKKDKNYLMQELVGMRQKHQSIDNQLQIIGKALLSIEHQQQQMMAFMAKTMQNPEFFAQLVHENGRNNRHMSSVNKKRKFPCQDDKMKMERSGLSDFQIVKYQPLMNEAAKKMFSQMLESTNLPEALTSDNFTNQSSGVTLSEVPPFTRIPYLPANSGILSTSYASSSTIPKIQSAEGMQEMITEDGLIDLPDNSSLSAIPQSISPYQTNMVIPNLFPMQEMKSQDSDVDSFTSATLEDAYVNPLSAFYIKEIIEPQYPDNFSLYPDTNTNSDTNANANTNTNTYTDDSNDNNLPEINDSFWEQFFAPSPMYASPEADYLDFATTQEARKEIHSDEEKIDANLRICNI